MSGLAHWPRGLGRAFGRRIIASSAFSPSDITGLQLWLKADAGVLDASGNPATNGVAVATWVNQLGSGTDATQETSSNRPVMDSTVANGRPAIKSVSADWLSGTMNGTAWTNGATIFFVVTSLGATGAIFSWGGVDSSPHVLLIHGASGWQWYIGGQYRNAFVPETGTTYLACITIPAANGNYLTYYNGTLHQTVSAWVDWQRATTYKLLSGYTGASNNAKSEVLIYDTVLGTENRQSVENHLMSKYGIT